MTSSAAERMTGFVVAFGLAMTALAYGLWGASGAGSAAVGVAVAVADLFVLRFVVRRLLQGNVTSKSFFAFVLVLKMFGLIGFIYLLMAQQLVAPMAFAQGMSALAGGVVVGGFFAITSAPQPARAGHGTQSER